MPLFGKRDAAPKSPEEMAAARERRRQMLEVIGATMSDIGSGFGGEAPTQLAALQAQRMKLAQQQRQQQAIQGLLGQIQPDTYTPQVNELIGEANLAGRGRFDPMAQMTPKAPAFDFTSPQGQAALMNALGSGVSVDGISALRDFLSPKAVAPKVFNVGDGTIVAVDEQGVAEPVYTSPLLQDYQRARIGATNAQAGQRTAQGNAALIRANRPTARGGGGGGANTPRPTGKV